MRFGWGGAWRKRKNPKSKKKQKKKDPNNPTGEGRARHCQQREEQQNPPCFPECLAAHKRSLSSEPETARSRRQKSANEAGSGNHNIMGLGAQASPTSSGSNPLEATRLFVVLR